MLSEDRIEKIKKMEEILNNGNDLLNEVKKIYKEWVNYQKKYEELIEYYYNEWNEDVEAYDEKLIPKDVNCGVLSEDSIYDLITEQRTVCMEVLKKTLEILERN